MSKVVIGQKEEEKHVFNIDDLTRHATILGSTGSGKTVFGKVLVEECLKKKIPVIAIDPKGDLGGLGIYDKTYDFRPFVTKEEAYKQQRLSKTLLKPLKKISDVKELNHKTKIYTPKGEAGYQISLTPDLSVPKAYHDSSSNIKATLVDSVADQITNIVNLGKDEEKAHSLIATIIKKYWEQQEDLTVHDLVEHIQNPGFEKVGNMKLNDFLSPKKRTKIAGEVNLLISKPSNKILSTGEKLSSKNMFQKNELSVFDLRNCFGEEDKQVVAEKIFQEIYKFLTQQKGSNKLRYVLYIDELASFLPPPPNKPASKKILETLIRQGRAFGLGIILATQNPGDIDYKVLGNIGNRFIGKVRSQNDIDKVATALDMDKSDLREQIKKLETGYFVHNNAIQNTVDVFKSRWVHTLHKGPLSDEEIQWVNMPKTRPSTSGVIDFEPKPVKINAAELVNEVQTSQEATANKDVDNTKTRVKSEIQTDLELLIKKVKKYSDETHVKISLSEQKEYTPHLRLIIAPHKFKTLRFEKQGPFIFDLTTGFKEVGQEVIKNKHWSQYVSNDTTIEDTRKGFKKAFTKAFKQSKRQLKQKVYVSKLQDKAYKDKERAIKESYDFIQKDIDKEYDLLDEKRRAELERVRKKINKNNDRIWDLQKKLHWKNIKRGFKRVILNKDILKKTKRMKYYEKRIRDYKKDNEKLRSEKQKIRSSFERKKQKVKDTYFKKARESVKTKTYVPKRNDVKIHATILLLPKKVSKR